MSYPQLSAYQLTTGTTNIPATQMSGSVSSPTTPRGCCENGRPIMTDPHSGQTICSCQYGAALLNYSRVSGLPEGVYGTPYPPGATQGYVPLGAEGSAFYSPLATTAFEMKEGSEAWRTLTQPGACFPYDPTMAIYQYSAGYGGLDLNARRKNATRETTNTLKAWLYEHRKNPYPTKGEKIMLAIITKMTLTQVSTWFANARRRLKKENKMTWSPRNRSEDAGENVDNDDDLDDNKENSTNGNEPSDESEEACGTKDQSHNAPEGTEKIISVDDDNSNNSLDDLDDLRSEEDDSDNDNFPQRKDSDTSSPSSNVGDSQKSPKETKTSSSTEGQFKTGSSESSTNSNTPRPKIWSVTDFLGNSKNESSNSKSANSAAVVCSRQKQDSFSTFSTSAAFIGYQSASQSLRSGQFSAALGYPLSLSHTTLSYPYSLPSSTSGKSGLGFHHAAFRMPEKDNLIDKHTHARLQNGLFSPARELDGLRVGSKVVM
ncbi:hypothetical protein CHS0354_034817 [Potamilus streckersoni]|uniref:Homeobox domain-containing protein n=2 Tax=Potamilus streckersoni TaxID=2493646 RepID=A0AAE0RT53_9BIVA|nr:hypothetical protein CHS0354_034817 [Potamilus streckersoni]